MIMMEEEFATFDNSSSLHDTSSLDEYGNMPEEEDIQIYIHRPNKFEKFLISVSKFFKSLFNRCKRKN